GLLPQAARDLVWPEGRVYIRVFSETKVVGEIRRFVREERSLDRSRYSVAAYWRRGATISESVAAGAELLATLPPDALANSGDYWNALMHVE
ncbi:MAG TPA: SIP domain-containing protein, partial [Acidimicrobiales bacterium]